MRLSENERNVLKRIMDNGRITDSDIAEQLSLSQQAVSQIRARLEETGVIQGYRPILNLEMLGIRILLFAGVEIQKDLWDDLSESEINQRLRDIPHLFELYRIPGADISHLAVYGFSDLKEQEEFMRRIESELASHISIKWSYSATVDNLLEDRQFLPPQEGKIGGIIRDILGHK
ncbi:MAG: Lrp/AsnC family transcriptional regulator [Nanobdellota archaeon]